MQRLWKLQCFVNRTRTVGHQCLGKKKAVSNFAQVANFEMALTLWPQVHMHHWHSSEVGRSNTWSVCLCWFHSLPLNFAPPVAIFSTPSWSCGYLRKKKKAFSVGIILVLQWSLPVDAVGCTHCSSDRLQSWNHHCSLIQLLF